MTVAWIVLGGLVLEAAVGYPTALHVRVPHPVVWVGRLMDMLEQAWNKPEYSFAARRVLGSVAMALLLAVAILIGAGVQSLAGHGIAGTLVIAVLGTVGLAQRSLFVHVNDVLEALRAS